MAIKIEKNDSGYTATVTPPNAGGMYWKSPMPMDSCSLIQELMKLGCHQTDIGDAYFDADPGWMKQIK